MSGSVQWYCGETEVQHGDNKYEMVASGKQRSLVVKNISKSDIGEYTCKCGTEKVTATMAVNGKK